MLGHHLESVTIAFFRTASNSSFNSHSSDGQCFALPATSHIQHLVNRKYDGEPGGKEAEEWTSISCQGYECVQLHLHCPRLTTACSINHGDKFFIFIFYFWSDSPQWAMASSFTRFLDHTKRRTTVGRTPLDERSARRRDLHLTTLNTHNRQTSMPPVGFEPTTAPSGPRPPHSLGF